MASVTSSNRLTGLATGLDIDSIIKTQMSVYENKVNSVIQKKDVLEIKQKLYRDILTETRDFYNKYLDPLSKDSLLMSSAYKTVKFTSSNENIVSVSCNSEAKVGSYTVTGTKATAAKITITDNIKAGEKLVINGEEFTLKGSSENEMAKNLNSDLKSAGLKVEVKYTNFASNVEGSDKNKSGLIIESTVLGKDSKLTVGGNVKIGTTVEGEDSRKATVTGLTIDDLKKVNGEITVGDTNIKITNIDGTNEEIIQEINSKLGVNFDAKYDEDGKITFEYKGSEVTGIEDPKIKFGDKASVFKDGSAATNNTTTISKDVLQGLSKININGVNISIEGNDIWTEDDWNNVLSSSGVDAKISGDNIILTSKTEGMAGNISVEKDSGRTFIEADPGKDANIIIKDSNGGVYTHTGTSNTITLDGVTFKINGDIPSEGITITGKTDVTEAKDKIVNFINDYNTLIKNLNTSINTKHDRDYVPLTSDQKEAMTEKEIELWEKKVQEGQLYRDSDLSRIASSLKQTMRTVMSGTGLNLEKIGIKPVSDYTGNNNGTFTIDEDKLTSALENDIDGVMNLFIGKPDANSTESQYTSNTGIIQQLKDTLYKEVMKSDSSLSKKVGIEGTSTFTNNTLTKNISDYETKIKQMQSDLARKEQLLYSKYANLETIMNQYNSQQSYLTSYLGS